MRTVFTNQQCAHVWAQLSQPHGRSGSMEFDGARAYSYSTVVAHLVRLNESTTPPRVLLYVPNDWGVTTAAHITYYRDAARRYQQFEVPDVGTYGPPSSINHKGNVAYLEKQYRKCAEGLMRKPADSYYLNPGHVREALTRLYTDVHDYCDAFRLGMPTIALESDLKQILDRRDRILNDPKRAAKAATAQAARAKREAEKARLNALALAEKIAAWRDGADVYLRDVPDMLRFKRGIVQTSRGAEVTIQEAQAALAFIVKAPRPWAGSVGVGEFTLCRIEEDGSVQVGCHTFSAEELEAFAKLVQS
jgi:hypothetical protein